MQLPSTYHTGVGPGEQESGAEDKRERGVLRSDRARLQALATPHRRAELLDIATTTTTAAGTTLLSLPLILRHQASR